MHTTQQFHQRHMYIHTETCTQTCTAALFIIAKVEKIPCLPTDECISKMSITQSQRGHGVDSYYNVDEPWKRAQVKEARHQRLLIIWFHLKEMSRVGKSTDRKMSGCLGLEMGGLTDIGFLSRVIKLIKVVITQLWMSEKPPELYTLNGRIV